MSAITTDSLMYWGRAWNIRCDRCKGMVAWNQADKRETVKFAKQDGWKIIGDDVVCPDCQKKEAQR